MIPFEEEASLNRTERRVESILESNWDNVVRSTPGIQEDLEGRYPELAEIISRRIMDDTDSDFSNVFRPGVPDFLAFSDSGDYLFVEAKSENDSLRHTQLKWLRDFRGIEIEIWFADNEKDIEKLEASDLNAYGFSDVKRNSSQLVVQEGLKVDVSEELAAITGLSEGDSVKWRLKSADELVLDTR
ncbi:VRR-NUC domain-containing protein [Candidatus Nanosalina sp. VS9-1]|uniref:VRR-NUC domain-containing protein n=1 Tax=Candidatus Nanosalina sp. VS9-1 TaxID=3388566 RepID=UPI0039DFEE8B